LVSAIPTNPNARQFGQLVLHRRVPVLLLHDGVGVRHGAVVTKKILEELDQRRLAVLPTPCKTDIARSLVEPVRL